MLSQGLGGKASQIWQGMVEWLARAGLVRVPVRSDHPIVHSKPMIHPTLQGSHFNHGMCSVLFSQGRIAFPAWAMVDIQRKWPHKIG